MAIVRNPHQSQRWGFFLFANLPNLTARGHDRGERLPLHCRSDLDGPHTPLSVLYRCDVKGLSTLEMIAAVASPPMWTYPRAHHMQPSVSGSRLRRLM
jgi:hypothetical protein